MSGENRAELAKGNIPWWKKSVYPVALPEEDFIVVVTLRKGKQVEIKETANSREKAREQAIRYLCALGLKYTTVKVRKAKANGTKHPE